MTAKNNDPIRMGNIGNMNTLSECLASTVKHGYTENFEITNNLLVAPSTQKQYPHQEVHIVNFFRFEGASNPDDMSILYVIETNDGTQGVLIDAYGTYADENVGAFIKTVEDFHKKERQ